MKTFLESLESLAEQVPERAFEALGFLYFDILRALTQDEVATFPNHYTRIVFLERNQRISAETARSARWLGLQWRRWKDGGEAWTPEARHRDRAIACLRAMLDGGSLAPEPETERMPQRTGELLACVVLSRDADTPGILHCSAEVTGQFRLQLPEAFSYIANLVWPMVRLNIIEPDFLGEDLFTVKPSGFLVLDPDMLVSASELKDLCAGGPQPRLRLAKLCEVSTANRYLLRGQVVNDLLDQQLLGEDSKVGEKLEAQIQAQPELALVLTPKNVETVTQDVEAHLAVLRHPNVQAVGASPILSLEPTFIAPAFGLRGRLDALDGQHAKEGPTVVELKTSKLPRKRHLNEADELQCLAYSLLIERTEWGQARSVNILYSATPLDDPGGPLRAVVAGHREQAQLLKLRNQMIYLEYVLATTPRRIFDGFDPEKCGRPAYESDFEKLRDLQEEWRAAPETVKAFVAEFSGLAAREHRCEWLGNPGPMGGAGNARMWNQAAALRVRDGWMITPLLLELPNQPDDELVFTLPEDLGPGDRFEPGVRVVVYHGEDPSASQHIAGTVTARNDSSIRIRPRHPAPAHLLERDGIWSLEADWVPGGLKRNIASLRSVLLRSEMRERYLGLRAPRPPVPVPVSEDILTSNQEQVVGMALGAPDYLLIQGPPGTGKTRYVIGSLVPRLLDDPEELLVCLAYTNRAVQEIADTLHEAGIDFALQGRSAPPHLEPYLLNRRFAGQGVEAIRTAMLGFRVFLSTTASWLGARTFWKLGFTTAIIDEASQLLEPHVAAILSTTPRFFLIGDQNQLPAVIQQDASQHEVMSDELHQLGFRSLSDSVFARLWRQATQNGWPVTAQLIEQGRMHRDIMSFPGAQFYGGRLSTLEARQDVAGPVYAADPKDDLDEILIQRRVAFFNTPATLDSRTSTVEAKLVAKIVGRLLSFGVSPKEIGVICPYRAQIQTIRSAFRKTDAAEPLNEITIDTVERYQGSSRRVIIVSFTVATERGLQHLESIDESGVVDRKLNVALTRAREQLLLIGHRQALEAGAAYGPLFEWLDEQGAVSFQG